MITMSTKHHLQHIVSIQLKLLVICFIANRFTALTEKYRRDLNYLWVIKLFLIVQSYIQIEEKEKIEIILTWYEIGTNRNQIGLVPTEKKIKENYEGVSPKILQWKRTSEYN